jgi:4-amino-4-deoxy-L-arabinose transferase-like glycosyltransferase
LAPAAKGYGLTERRDWIMGAILPATLLCGLNCFKPLVVDDPAYHAYAAQIARAPLDPYGFSINWYDHFQPADTVLAPPALLYWWALGIRLFGDEPLIAKMWLWPWCLALAGAVYSLARRFAGNRSATPLTWMIVLSPSVLPSLNLMLDVPALALSLLSLATFLATTERRQFSGAIAAGLVAGLAMQTKYTALMLPAELAMAAWCATNRGRELLRAILATAVAASIFVGWELLVAIQYGQSHFLFHGTHDPDGWLRRSGLISPLVGLLGSVATPIAILGLAIHGYSITRLIMTVCSVAIGFVIVAIVPRAEHTLWTPTAVVFGLLGVVVIVIVCVAIKRILSNPGRASSDMFLVGWLIVELAGYFVLTPWPAVRRVIPAVVAMTFLVGRGARRTEIRNECIGFAAAFSVGLGLFIEAIDIENARVEQNAVATIDARLRRLHPNATIWFVGHRGWQYYAECAGWQHAEPASFLFAGDWLVAPDSDFGSQRFKISPAMQLVESIEFHSRWRLGTIPWYYGTNAAVRKRDGPYFTVDLYRVNSEADH